MSEPILFTPQDIVNAILVICGAITAVAAATTVIVKIVTSIKRPNKIQDQKIADLEKSVKEIREDMEEKEKEITRKFRATSQSIDDAQEAAVVTQRALLALLSHAINGNDTESLKKAKTDLEEFLTSKKG